MLLTGVVVGLLLGLAVGGRLSALVNARLRYAILLFAAIALRFGTQLLISRGVDLADQLRVPLFATAFAMLIVTMWLNRRSPGMLVVLVGVAFNATAILVNGGHMPVWLPAVTAAGLAPTELDPTYHVALPMDLGTDFLLMAGPLGDIIPFPAPLLPNVVSVGDVLISVGLGWFVFATLRWGDPDPDDGGVSLWSGPARPDPGSAALARRPVIMGTGMGPGRGVRPQSLADGNVGSVPAAPVRDAPWRPSIGRPSIGERVRTHPYVRLARDARFSAFWVGQTTSAFGDKLNQIALAWLVVTETASPLLSGLVFVAAMLPNLLIGPIAGTLVDRWDQKRVMVAADIIRAGLVLVLPFAYQLDLALAYVLVFLITSVSLFFRPARAAVLPRIVKEEDLLPANSAMWTGETLMEVGGYPLAGLLVSFLGGSLALAFWIDAASYVVSGALIAGIAIPPVVRTIGPRVGGAIRTFLDELRDGWSFLRASAPLFQNTLISLIGQLSIGATIALTPYLVSDLLGARSETDGSKVYSTLEGAIGLGNLVGAFVVGLVGVRMRKGPLVIGGFVLMGIATVVWGLAGDPAWAIGAALAVGIFNLIWLVPSQTLFGELVPSELMGRVISIRGALVFGSMTASAALSSLVAEAVPVGTVIAALGGVTVVAGLAGALLPAVRDT